jgi:hypothetical protein
MLEMLPALVAGLSTCVTLLVERVAAGARAAQYRVERDAAQLQADRMRLGLLHMARDVARLRAEASSCRCEELVRLADEIDAEIDSAMR